MKFAAPLNHEPIPSLQWIEVATSFQIPSFQIIGLPGPEVSEAKDRVRSAIESVGLEFPKRKVVVNLSPAHIRKSGTGIDLGVALAVLGCRNALPEITDNLKIIAWGELGLDGQVKPAFHLTRVLFAAVREGVDLVLVSRDEMRSAEQALLRVKSALCDTTFAPKLVPVTNLGEAWALLNRLPSLPESRSSKIFDAVEPPKPKNSTSPHLLPISDSLKRIIGVCASGRHHLMILGSKGSGKTRALEWLQAVLPTATPETALAQEMLSEVDRKQQAGISPVRKVSSSCRPAALMGSVSLSGVRPGEFSLAHGGLLVADEFPEWHRDSREALREPLERGFISLTRASASVELPAQFIFAATGNLCACGGWPRDLPIPIEWNSKVHDSCRCSELQRRAYLSKLSGPILDRIDLLMLLSQAPPDSKRSGDEMTEELREKCEKTQKHCIRSWGKPPGEIQALELEYFLRENLHWDQALKKLKLTSLRSRHKILRIALTLGAWDGQPEPSASHFTEASLYRPERFGFSD
jgi:magnesium chelatase family protein